MGDFLDRFFPPTEKKKPKDPKKLSRRTVKADKYDDKTFEHTLELMPDFDTARARLCDRMTETGNGMTGDVFHLLYKVEPTDRPHDQIRPDYFINALVRDKMRGLDELEELRSLGCVGDAVNAGLGFVSLRKSIEEVHDKTQVEQDLMQELLEQMAELAKQQKRSASMASQVKKIEGGVSQAQDDLDAAEEALAAAQAAAAAAGGDEEGEGDGEGAEGDGDGVAEAQAAVDAAQAAVDSAQQQLDAAQSAAAAQEQRVQSLEESIAAAEEAIEQGLDAKDTAITNTLRDGLDDAIGEVKAISSLATSWGVEPGVLTRMPPAERLALAKKIKESPKLQQLAQIIGRDTRILFAEQRKQVRSAHCEITDVEIGNDLSRLLPIELIKMRHPVFKRDFRRRFIERSLTQYRMGGTEKIGMGSIIAIYDGSMSMAGDQEIAAKSVAIALNNLAKEQKRAFKAIQFGSPGQLMEWDFSTPEDYTFEKVFEMAEFFFNGGTDFQTPLSRALTHLQAENTSGGAVRGDIVFITDGECGVDPTWLKEFKDEQARLAFHVFGVNIGGNRDDEPLFEICDGRVVTWNDLTSVNELRDVFREIHKPI